MILTNSKVSSLCVWIHHPFWLYYDSHFLGFLFQVSCEGLLKCLLSNRIFGYIFCSILPQLFDQLNQISFSLKLFVLQFWFSLGLLNGTKFPLTWLCLRSHFQNIGFVKHGCATCFTWSCLWPDLISLSASIWVYINTQIKFSAGCYTHLAIQNDTREPFRPCWIY